MVGRGGIGRERASLFNALGSKVTLIEILPRILSQEEITSFLEKSLKKRGVALLTQSKVKEGEKEGKGVRLKVKTREGEKEIFGEKVLVWGGGNLLPRGWVWKK